MTKRRGLKLIYHYEREILTGITLYSGFERIGTFLPEMLKEMGFTIK